MLAGAGTGSLRAPPYSPLGQAPLSLFTPWAPYETAPLRCRQQRQVFPPALRGRASADVPRPEARLRRGAPAGAPGLPTTGTGSPEPRRWPCRKPPVCLGTAQGPRWAFSFSSRDGREAGEGTVALGKVAFSPKCENGRKSLPLCPLGGVGERSRAGKKEFGGSPQAQMLVGPLRLPGLRGLFNPPIAITLTGV